jgi:hypothetical protein
MGLAVVEVGVAVVFEVAVKVVVVVQAVGVMQL